MATPMQQQYDKLKKKHEDCILLFRLGDFYECFDNDAKIISKVLGIVLTKRGKGANTRPMAGIPYHALDNYLHKLVDAGYKAAIVEQLEEPQKGKQIVDRDVVKIVSAGTITSEKSLSESKNNYIACISNISTKKLTTWGLAICELTTGEFYLSEYYSKSREDISEILAEVKRIHPAEILISAEDAKLFKGKLETIRIQEVEEFDFSYSDNKKRLQNHFKVKTLKGFGIDKYKAGICAAGVILDYLQETQKASLNHINRISYRNSSKYMLLDESTIRNLELVVPLRGNESVTLLRVLDKCLTPMGKRKLYNWLLKPLKHVSDIKERLDSTEELFRDSVRLGNIRDILDNIYDIERILGKIGTESVNARDLLALKDSLTKASELQKHLRIFKSPILKSISKILSNKNTIEKVAKRINDSIHEDPPVTITEGGMIKEGYSKKLDKITKGAKEGKEWLKTLEQEEREKTSIQSLKVKFNKVFGYYIEVSKANLDKVPDDYVRKQTLVNAERFITPELKEKEDLILHSEERSMELEYVLFVEIRKKISKHIKKLQEIADAIAVLDCLANFAQIARLNDHVKPELLDDGKAVLEIKDGRHPVVEQIQEEAFISNDTELNCKDKQIAIITGPNMAGKSTYIRQVALITLMAQIGSFVPAASMRFKPVDRIFTRVGASDNLSAGESTFLVEMNETANILNNATSDSLIILDEVGRGTSTYDGVAIAWAVAEFIHEHIGAKTLFATHYHELIDLKKYLKRIVNLNVTVEESKNKVIFLRKIEEGGTDKSYGVHVAEMSGIPEDVIKKAKEILMSLEQEGMFEVQRIESESTNRANKTETTSPQMQLLTKLPENPVVKELKELDVNKMTPLEALEKLNDLVQKMKK
jgi:DNA mismatch repair protein MutS